jgi:hypothetical protein
MLSMPRGPLTAGLIATSMLCCTADAHGAAKIVRGTAAAGDVATLAPSFGERAFMRSRYWRVRTFAPYFNSRLGWAPGAWVTQNALALDAADPAAWQLRDVYNAPLYTGSQVPAADIGNPDFRAAWIARAQAAVAAGYKGLFIDDVFMERRTYTSGGMLRMPRDPRTGTTMTEANWQKYLADFVAAVRAALPNAEIVHDVLWQKGDGGHVLRGLQAADAVSVDGGFTTGVVQSTWATLAGWAEREQARGASVIFDASTASAPARLYGLASSLLTDHGKVAIANDASTAPGAFWPGYDLDLGAAVTARYQVASGVWRRDFARGIVLVNEPYRGTRTVSLPAGLQDLDGVARSSVTLGGGQGMVLVPVPPAPTPTPTPTPPSPPVAPTLDPVKPVAPAPVPQAPVAPVAPVATPAKMTTPTRGGDRAARARTSGTAGARAPGTTSVSVRGSARRLSGRVRGAAGGYVRLTVERKRGRRWVVAVRTGSSVKKSGSFARDIPRLRKGSYRVTGSFQGTGTSKPSRSSAKPFRAG